MASKEMLEAAARQVVADHREALGRVYLCGYICGNDANGETIEFALKPPIPVLVLPTDADNLVHNTGTHMDPYWNVQPLAGDDRIAGLSNLYSFGPSYCIETGQEENEHRCLTPAPWIDQLKGRAKAFCGRCGYHLRQLIPPI